MRFGLLAALLVFVEVAWSAEQPSGDPERRSSEAAETPAGFRARHDHFFNSCDGFLIFTDRVISYEPFHNQAHARQWRLAEVADVERLDRRSIAVEDVDGDREEYNLLLNDFTEKLHAAVLAMIATAEAP